MHFVAPSDNSLRPGTQQNVLPESSGSGHEVSASLPRRANCCIHRLQPVARINRIGISGTICCKRASWSVENQANRRTKKNVFPHFLLFLHDSASSGWTDSSSLAPVGNSVGSAHKRGVTRSPQAPSSPCHATKLTDFRQSLEAGTRAGRSDPNRCQQEMRKHRSLLNGVKLRYSEILFLISPLYSCDGQSERIGTYVGFCRRLLRTPFG